MTEDATDPHYYFAVDAEDDEELARLTLLESLCDPVTFRCLDTIGVGEGWLRADVLGLGAASILKSATAAG